MIISETPYSKRLIGKKIDENTFELIDVIDLSHHECTLVIIDGSAEVLEIVKDENQ